MVKNRYCAGKGFALLLTACFAAFLFLMIFCTAVSAANMPVTITTAKADLNIRTKADTYSDILTVIDKEGTVLYPVSETTLWYKIRFANNVYGYVCKDYVKTGGAIKSSVSLFPGAAVRTAASSTAKIQKTVSVATELSISAQNGDWYYVTTFGGEKGYILKSSVAAPKINYPAVKPVVVDVPAIDVYYVSSTTAANIRSTASTSGTKMASVNNGTMVTVISSEKGTDGHTWYAIRFDNGKKGYLRDDTVTKFDLSKIKGKKIVIDPGHGSTKESGGVDGNIGVTKVKEKDVNLAIARYLQSYLVKAGADVTMTRTTDTTDTLTLDGRAAIANNQKADIFISVHCNTSTRDPKKTGTITNYFGGNNQTSVADTLKKKRVALADAVQNTVCFDLGTENLGTVSDNFTVLVRTTMPSILVELGFLSNATEEKLLTTKDYQIYCAQGMYKGLLRYFK